MVELHRSGFRAMGTTWTITLHSASAADAHRRAVRAAGIVEDVEQALSRFRPDSDLARLDATGRVTGSPHLTRCVELALEAHELTGGAFDVTIRDALERAGYDRTFTALAGLVAATSAPEPAPGMDGIRLDPLTGSVEVPDGVRIDLGGIGKGYAADLVADALAPDGPVLVDAGGDIALRGAGPEDDLWPIALPEHHASVVLLGDAGIATSGTDRRRWRTDHGDRHHVIDPATGDSTTTDVGRVTVVAPTLVDADVLATTALVLGEAGARRLFAELPVHAWFETIEGAAA